MAQSFWQRPWNTLRVAMTLARWRWREQWFLVLVNGLGILAATTLICALPLFSTVMVTAGLRSTLRVVPDSGSIHTTINLGGLSSTGVSQATAQINAMFAQDLHTYLDPAADPAQQLEVGGWRMAVNDYQLILHGATMQDAAPHLQVLQGRLPIGTSTPIETALTRSAASIMGVHLGSTISIANQVETSAVPGDDIPQIYNQTLTLHVVGIVQTAPDDAYWNGLNFEEATPTQAGPAPFYALIDSSVLLHMFDKLAHTYSVREVLLSTPCQLFLTYTLDPTHMRGDQLTILLNDLATLQADAARQKSDSSYIGQFTFPYIAAVILSGATLHSVSSPELLDIYQNEVLLNQVTLLLLTLQITLLILCFIGILAGVLVEQQTTSLALLRSRGASRAHILSAICLQALLLCVVAGLLAPLLALGIVDLVAPLFLHTTTQDALNVLPHSLPELLNTVGLYISGSLLLVLGTLGLAVLSALRQTYQTLRREAARATQRPLWQRLRLDLVLAILGLASFAFIYYAQDAQQFVSGETQQLLVTPLTLGASLLLLLAGLLAFLRFTPLFLRIGAQLAERRRSAASVLALAQMARAPRQSLRMIVLLSLATGLTLFTLIFSASQTQHIQDLAAYQAGADFSGSLPLNLQTTSMADLARIAARYQSIQGVAATSVGYTGQDFLRVNPGSPAQFLRKIQLHAVDTQTFAHAAAWSPTDSSQTLPGLLAQLTSLRTLAAQRDVVPAILSASAWQILQVHPGSTFTLIDPSGDVDPLKYLAVASVAHIPPADENSESGMLLDLQSLFTSAQRHQDPLALNAIWLRTSDNALALQNVRVVLHTSLLATANLADRRAIAQSGLADPLTLNILAVLTMGIVTAILLALLANLLLPVLSIRTRLTQFAFLRALGAPPTLVALLLAWEQCFILAVGLLLGLFSGLLLGVLAVPQMLVTSIPPTSLQQLNVNAAYDLQQLIPATLVLPPSLLLALLILLTLAILNMAAIVGIALRPTLSQQLRLNED